MRALTIFCLVLSAAACSVEEPTPPAPAAASPPSPARSVSYTDVTAEAGIEFIHVNGAYGKKYLPETMGSGVAVLDYDGDGLQDMFFINGRYWPDDPRPESARGPSPSHALYRNLGDGTFQDRTLDAGLAVEVYGMGAAAGDYDNDGDTDLFVTTIGPDLLFRNDGGRFTEVAGETGVADPGFGSSAAFLDHDRDGDLDLFVCNYVEWSLGNDLYCSLDGQNKAYCTPESYRGQSSRLYRNEGAGVFTDVSADAGVLNPGGKSLGVSVLDFDDDGWMDIAVANDTQPNYLYRNNGDGTFTDVGPESGVAFSESGVARGAMGIDAADYDRSGRESLVIGNFSNQMIGLYHNEGSGLFIDDAARAGVGLPSLLTLAFGCFFLDYDLDGNLDIFVANGHVENDINIVQRDITYAQKPHLFRGRGDGSFEEASRPEGGAGAIFQRQLVARGAAYLDYDADGDLDVVLTTNGGPAHLLRNDGGNAAGWIRVKLEGSSANKDGIGSRVKVVWDNRSASALVKSGSSYCSQSETVLTFGLGEAETVDHLEITWPDGTSQIVRNPPTRSLVVVTQGDGTAQARAGL